MKNNRKKKQAKQTWIITGVVVVFFSITMVWTVSALIKDDGAKRRRQIQMVTLVKPPPPPKIEEKPPEPEVEKEEEIVEPEPEEAQPEPMNDNQDQPPPGENLGVDADGSAGSDSFGLVGKKGGRALIGGSGDRTMMQRYGWYAQIIQEEIRKRIKDHMTKNGGIPQGEHKALIQIELDAHGRIVDYKLQQSSGNENVDQALRATLTSIHVSEAPPEGMPRAIRLKISSRG